MLELITLVCGLNFSEPIDCFDWRAKLENGSYQLLNLIITCQLLTINPDGGYLIFLLSEFLMSLLLMSSFGTAVFPVSKLITFCLIGLLSH